MQPEKALKDRVAIVTGGGKGIGRSIALAYATAGASVVICGRSASLLEQVSREAQEAGGYIVPMPMDVTVESQVESLVAKTLQKFGKIDILVNNAGIASRGNSVFNTDVDELRRVIDTHVFGSFHFTQAVLANMRQQPRGDIIFISSGAAEGGGANGAPYGMAKRAMEALAAALSREELANGIRVNVVRPGLIETDMGSRLVKATRGVQDIKELYASSPFGRVGQPSDIGNAVAFLVSQKGEYITNAVIKVSGG